MFWVKFYVAMIKGTNNYMPPQEKKVMVLERYLLEGFDRLVGEKKW